MTSIEASGITVHAAGRAVLDGAALSARAGRIVALLGPNGAGKSTLLRVMAGLTTPSSGTVRVDAVSLDAIDPRTRARRIAWLAQDRSVHWPMPVRAIVALGRLPHVAPGGRLGASDVGAVGDACRAMGVTELAERPVLELSGGERARVLMARALAQEPAVLLADEPVAGLDPAHQMSLMQHLRRCAAGGMCVVTAMHDLSLAARFADDAVLIAGGRTLAAGLVRDVLTAPRLQSVYGIGAVVTEVDGIPVVVPRDVVTTPSP